MLGELAETLEVPWVWLIVEDGAGAPELYAHHGFDSVLSSAEPLRWPVQMPEGNELLDLEAGVSAPFAGLNASARWLQRLPSVRRGICGLYSDTAHVLSDDDKALVCGLLVLLTSRLEESRVASAKQASVAPGVLVTEGSLQSPGPRIVYANSVFAEMMGYSASEIEGQTPRMFQGALSDRQVLGKLKRDLLTTGRAESQLVNYHRDGTPLTLNVHVEALYDEQGRTTSFVSVHQPGKLSGRTPTFAAALEYEALLAKRLRRDPQRTEEVSSTLFMAGSLGCLISSSDGRIVEVNRHFSELFGYRREELLGHTSLELGLWDEASQRQEIIDRVNEHGEVRNARLRVRSKRGELLTVLLSVEGLELLGGSYTLAFVENVSARADLEAEVAASRSKLVQAREHERLQLARNLHDDAMQTLIGVSYSLARVRRDIGERMSEEPDRSSLLQNLEGQREQVLEVARGLRLLISQLRPAGIEEFGLVASLQNLLTQLRRNHPGLRLHFTETSLPQLPIDIELALYRVAQEGLRNAIKHAHAATIWLELELGERYLCVAVRDDGRGFDLPKELSGLADNERYGLLGIAESLESLGGFLNFTRPGGSGFRLAAFVPLTAPPNRTSSTSADT